MKNEKITKGERMKQLTKEHTKIIEKKKQFVYEDCYGNEIKETVGCYNSCLTNIIKKPSQSHFREEDGFF